MVLIALSVAGFSLSVLGGKRSQPPVPPEPKAVTEPAAIEAPFVLTLSAPADSISIESLGRIFEIEASSQSITGTLPLEEGHPTLFVDIAWKDRNPSPRFAKLVIEPPGHATLTRIFDSNTDLSDVWEIHLHE